MVFQGLWSRVPQLRESRGRRTCRRSKVPFWVGQEEERDTAIGTSFSMHMRTLRGWGYRWQASTAQATSTTGSLLHGLQVAEQTTSVNSDSRGWHGLSPLGVHEQASPVAPVTSEVVTQEGSAIEHHLLLLSFPLECTHCAADTANCTRHQVQLPEGHCN